ncbi:23S rRNA (uracil(1939)-C(5))-methyltransferase RlmD [Candidatus Gracilibacteria bacterium]|nr:23S rRNA (uracil(1939)-C(5))-methyltransferase RlmD [Candidatus Gracilibacteria bacterium]
MALKKGDTITLTINKLVFGGMGLGTHDGIKIFVPDSVPGDTVEIRIRKKKNSYAEGVITQIITSSPQRIVARCRHFEQCGGCTWQFLSYPDQLTYKQGIVTESFEHIGAVTNTQSQPIIGSDQYWHYRNKMEFSFATDEAGTPMLGLHPKGYHYDVFDLEECFLPHPIYAEIVKLTRAWAKDNAISIYTPRTNSGTLHTMVIRHNQADQFLINIITREPELPAVAELKQALAHLSIVSCLHTHLHSEVGHATTKTTKILWGTDHLSEELDLGTIWGKLDFTIYPEAFFQPNPRQATILYRTALNQALIKPTDTVLDLYCGTGTLGLFASRQAKQVIGIDNVADAIKSANDNARRNQCTNATFHTGDTATVLQSLQITPTVAIIDPPRAGLLPDAVTEIIKLNLQRLVYISCNPTTQARDIRLFLDAGYQIISMQPVDMFPHTYHIENIVVIEKSSTKA